MARTTSAAMAFAIALVKCHKLTVPDAARRAGVNKTSVYRALEANTLTKEQAKLGLMLAAAPGWYSTLLLLRSKLENRDYATAKHLVTQALTVMNAPEDK